MSGKQFLVDSRSPYYLHLSEGPEGLIPVVIFDGTNYDVWERGVETTLKAKNNLGFIKGMLPKPKPKIGKDTTDLQT